MADDKAVKLSEGMNKFSSRFYKETAAQMPGKNLIMSPMSAEIILALLSMGARGQTEKELNSALNLPDSQFTRETFGPFMKRLQNTQGVTLNVANKVFVKEGKDYELNDDFKRTAVDTFQSEAQNLDFGQAVKAASTINTWVEDKTNKRIKDLIKSESLSDDTRLVLVNAIYFKGNWNKKFKTEQTRQEDFHVSTKDTIKVDMMHQTGNFPYAEVPEWKAKIIELPYEKKEMSMVIILPNEIDGLAFVEQKLAEGDSLNTIMQSMHEVEVSLSLPKFKIETTIDLKKVLPKLGMQGIFNSNANLTGLLKNDEQLYVSDAVQKAFIEVNEEGAEAAAATGMMLMCRMLPMQIPFLADRPFYCALVADSKALFVGKVLNPSETSQ